MKTTSPAVWGDDFIGGGSDDDELLGGHGNDTIIGGPGNDLMFGGLDNDSLCGGLGDDELRGGDGNDSLFGEAGVDVLLGGPGVDELDQDSPGPCVSRSNAFEVTHVPLYTFNGDGDSDEFGFSVSGVGDVNGDGLADLIVGAPGDDNNGSLSGSAQVLSGLDGSILYNVDGDSAGDQFGTSVSSAGDVNGDGLADLIVGAYGDDNNGRESGSARVFSGLDGSILYTFDGDDDVDSFGRSVSSAGDVNGDGRADVIVGATGDDNNGPASGSARVFSGLDGSILYTFDGDNGHDSFGTSVSSAGDVNGDGRADLIVGALRDDDRFGSSGIARVFSGHDGSILYTFDDDGVDGFGWSVSGAGDVNGDGLADLIVGVREDDNNGPSSGSARVISGIDGSVLYTFDGDVFDLFGDSVSSAGDVNGDGLADFIVGAFLGGFDSDGYNLGGSARVFVSQVTPVFLLGDVNRDDVVNFLDIAPFISLLSNSVFQIEADIDGDGSVTFLDIGPFIAILSSQ